MTGCTRRARDILTRHDQRKKSRKNSAKAKKEQLILKLEKEMKAAAKLLEFEHAAFLRDKIAELRG